MDTVFYLAVLTLASFWVWDTVRFLLETYLPSLYSLLTGVQPLIVLAFPLWVLWPDWLTAMAVTTVVGLINRFVGGSDRAAPVSLSRKDLQARFPKLP